MGCHLPPRVLVSPPYPNNPRIGCLRKYSSRQAGLPAKPTLSADWNTFSLLVADTPLHATASFAETALGLYVSGRHRIGLELGRRSVEAWSDPGTINLSPPGLEAKWEASASSRAAVLFVPQAFLRA
jgi:hypothetical protein